MSALQAGFDDVMKKVGEALVSSQAKKRAATMSPDGSSSGQGASRKQIPPLPGSASPVAPLNTAQSSMVAEMVQSALGSAVTGMSSVIERHLAMASGRLDTRDKQLKDADDKMNYTNAQMEKYGKELDKMRVDIGSLKQEAETSTARAILAEQALAAIGAAGPPPGLPGIASGSSQAGGQLPYETPYELRTHAVMGGLGWDESAERLMEKAVSTLTKAGVDTATFSAVTAIVSRNNEGSTVQLVFRTSQELASAKLQVRSAACKGWNDKNIWLDAKKSRTEMKPARLVHRIAQVLNDFEDSRADKLLIEKRT